MKDFFKEFFKKESSSIVQFIKYAICGGIATFVNIVIFFLLAATIIPALTESDIIVKLLHLPPAELSDQLRARNFAIDNIIAFIFSNLTAYILNILWVFKRGRHAWIIEFAMFFAVSGLAILVGTSLGVLLIKVLGMHTSLAFVANMLTSLALNFVLRKFVIFKG
ncbi:MAG: GtrA family protein [Lentisphaerae bacterium]|jgi:putative flippase GtrA|nr:GtrA family protein [Lentisphaerota bacterium]